MWEMLVTIIMKWNEGKIPLSHVLLELGDKSPQRRPVMVCFGILLAWACVYQSSMTYLLPFHFLFTKRHG